MTLVVCKDIDGDIRFESDTLIWNDLTGKREPFLKGKLKTIILDENHCLAFAGDVSIAQKAITDMGCSIIPFNRSKVIAILSEASKFGAEFILASLIPKSEIVVIKEGKIEAASSVWIGNQKAFQKFQQFWVPRASSVIPREERSRLIGNAFQSVIEAGVDNVGDLQISVGSKNGYFTYKAYTRIYYPKHIVQSEKKQLFLDNRGFALSCLRSEKGTPFSIAFYFNPIRLGALLTAADGNLIPIRGFDESEFLQHVRNQYNIELTGLMNLSDGRMIAVGKSTVNGRMNFEMEVD